MNGTLSVPHGCMVGLPGATNTSLRPTGSAQTALVYDERMERHVEGRHQPHPERPDRVRAVMARLLTSGLASESHDFPQEIHAMGCHLTTSCALHVRTALPFIGFLPK